MVLCIPLNHSSMECSSVGIVWSLSGIKHGNDRVLCEIYTFNFSIIAICCGYSVGAPHTISVPPLILCIVHRFKGEDSNIGIDGARGASRHLFVYVTCVWFFMK